MKSETSKLKKKAWDSFSIYIRTRDCLRFSGSPDFGKCITCNRAYDFKQLQAGHFIQGRMNSVLFDERLVYSQCLGCNGNPPYGKGGNYVAYTLFMLNVEEYTVEEIEEFNNLKHKTVIYKNFDYIRLKEEFDQKTKELLDTFNNHKGTNNGL